MNEIAIAKQATSIILGIGTSKIVNGIIRTNTNPQTVIDTVTIGASSLVAGMMFADAASEFTNAKIDAIVVWFEKNKDKTPTP